MLIVLCELLSDRSLIIVLADLGNILPLIPCFSQMTHIAVVDNMAVGINIRLLIQMEADFRLYILLLRAVDAVELHIKRLCSIRQAEELLLRGIACPD